MSRDLQRFFRRFEVMRSHSATLARLVEQVDSNGVAEAIRHVERQQAAIMKALSFTDYAARHAELFKSATRLHELSLQPLVNMQNTLDQVHRSWLFDLSNIKPFIEPAEIAKITLSDTSHHLATMELLWAGIDYNALARALNVQQSIMDNVKNSMSSFTASYRNLTESFESVADVVTQPSFVLPGATQEVSTTGYALAVLHSLEDEAGTDHVDFGLEGASEDSDLVALLEGLGIGLVDTYRGAVQALNGDNPDRSRHVLSSLRTLVDHLLRKLAPNGKVREWIVDRGYHSYLDNGRTTRRAQILYMSKDIEAEPLTKFIEADTKTVEELYTLYNRLHSLGTGISDSQLRAIELRTASYLKYILRVREW